MDVNLPAYEGPLDLLLKLIAKNEIDIYDIPISTLTAQYLEEIAVLPPDMEQLSEFLVMAATLLEIKSRMLLPRPKIEAEEAPGDPREALVQQLLAYAQAQALAKELDTLTPMGEKITGKGDRYLLQQMRAAAGSQPIMDNVTLQLLGKVFTDVLTRKESRTDIVRAGYGEMPRDRFTITDKVSFIQKTLSEKGRLNLFELFYACQSKHEMIVTFLAVLEMVRQGQVNAVQNEAFDDVEVVQKCQA